MREASVGLKSAGGLRLRGCFAALLPTVAAGALGGCAEGGATSGAFAMASNGATVAFDTIDGPPPQVFDRMVGVLDRESRLHNLAIVSREGQAAYRVRGYLAAQVVHGRTMIAWVWDVYDRNEQRALRLSGEEPAGKAGRAPWSAADDLVLHKIAQAGLSGLASMANETPQEAAPPPSRAPAEPGQVVASMEPRSPISGENARIALGYLALK